MRKSLLGLMSVLLTGAGLALAQTPPTEVVAPPADPASGAPTAPEFGREAPIPAPGRLFADAEYLFWFSRPLKLPPLIVAGTPSPTGAPPAIGQEGTTTLVGDREVEAGARSGMRLRAGFWLDSDETLGLEASGFFLEPIGFHSAVASNNTSVLGLSYQNASLISLPPETSLVFALPGVYSGSSEVQTSTKFWGADLNATCNVAGASWYRADALIGFRYLRLQEDLTVNTTSTALPGGLVEFEGDFAFSPASTLISDSFRTVNDFYGGQVGAHILLQKGIWFADFRGLLAAGVTHEAVTVAGSTTLTATGPVIGSVTLPAGTTTVPGGLLAQQTNLGQHTNNEFTIVPEGIVSIGCQVTSYLRVYAGYSVLYWRQSVVRPDTEIDRLVSPTAIPTFVPAPLGTELHPAPQLNHVDFWAQGVHFGVEVDF